MSLRVVITFGGISSKSSIADLARWRLKIQSPRVAIVTALILAVALLGIAQQADSPATAQKFLGFEDQTGTTLTGWSANPPSTVSADDPVSHTGSWSVRLQSDVEG